MLVFIPFLFSLLHVSQAVQIYLNPSKDVHRSTLSLQDASSVLSHHLGLEIFEPLRDASILDYSDPYFVGKGSKSALLLAIEEADVAGLSHLVVLALYSIREQPSYHHPYVLPSEYPTLPLHHFRQYPLYCLIM